MDPHTISTAVEAHAQAVVEPMDPDRLRGDLIEDLLPALVSLPDALPQPVTSAEVTSLKILEDHADAVITYRGDSGSLTVKSRWEDRGAGRPQVVAFDVQG